MDLELAQALPMLTLFTRALAQRSVHLNLVPEDEFWTIHWRRRLGSSSALVVPKSVGVFSDVRGNLRCYRAIVLYWVVLCSSGDDETEADRREAVTGCSPLMQRLFSAFEDLRVFHVAASRFPGALTDIAELRAHLLLLRCVVSVPDGIRGLVEKLQRCALGSPWREALQHTDPRIVAGFLTFERKAHKCTASWRDSWELAFSVVAYSSPRMAIRALSVRGKVCGEGQEWSALPMAAEPLFGGGDDRLRVLPSFGRVDGVGGNIIAVTEGGARHNSNTGTGGERSIAAALPREAKVVGPATGNTTFHYGEWDSQSRVFRTRWCQVSEFSLTCVDPRKMEESQLRNELIRAQLRRDFKRMQASSCRKSNESADGDELDLNKVLDYWVDRRRGITPSEKYYRQFNTRNRELAMVLLLDVSASTDFCVPGADPGSTPTMHDDVDDVYLYGGTAGAPSPAPTSSHNRRVIDVIVEAAAILAEAADHAGDRCAIHCFSGAGRSQVNVGIAKEFGERFGHRTLGRLAAVKPGGSTRTGAAVRHASARLLEEGAQKKILILVTDGYPEDTEYGPRGSGVAYGLADTEHALRSARDAGLDPFCISIDPAGHNYLRKMCRARDYLVLRDIDALATELPKIYQALSA